MSNDTNNQGKQDMINEIPESMQKTISMIDNVFGYDSASRMKVLLESMKGFSEADEDNSSSSYMSNEQTQELHVRGLSKGVSQWLPLINEVCAGYPEVPADIMARIVQKESRGDRFARPMETDPITGRRVPAGSARGLTQITDGTLITFLGRDLRSRDVREKGFDKYPLRKAKEVYLRHTGLTESDIDRFDAKFNLEVTAQNLTNALKKKFFADRIAQHPERRGFYTYLAHHDGAGEKGAQKTVQFLEKANGNFTEEFWNENKEDLPKFHKKRDFDYTRKVISFALTVNGSATDEELQRLTNTRVHVKLDSVTQPPLTSEQYLQETPSELNQEPLFWIQNFNIIGDSNALGLTNVAHKTGVENENDFSTVGAQSEAILKTKVPNLILLPKPTTVVCCGYNDMNALGANPTEKNIKDEATDYINLIDAVYSQAQKDGTKVIVMIPHTFIPKGAQATEESQHKFQNKLKELINTRGYDPSILRVIDNSPLRDILHPKPDVKRAWMARIQQIHFELNPPLDRSEEGSLEGQPEAPSEASEQISSGQGGSVGGGSDDSGSSSGSGNEE